MKKIIYIGSVVFSVLTVSACGPKTNDSQETETKKEGPVFELKEEIQAPKADTIVVQKDSTARK